MCEDAGVVLAFLPPYLPDLNPIEETFAQLKAWIKKNKRMVEGFQDYGDFLCMVLAVLQSDVKEHFGAVISVVQCRAMMITWRAIMKMLMMNKVSYIVTTNSISL